MPPERPVSLVTDVTSLIRRAAAPLEALVALFGAVVLIRQQYAGLGSLFVCTILTLLAFAWAYWTWSRRQPSAIEGARGPHKYARGVRWTALAACVVLVGTTSWLAAQYVHQKQLPEVKLEIQPTECRFTNNDDIPLKSVRIRVLEHVSVIDGWHDGPYQMFATDLVLDRGEKREYAVGPGKTVAFAHDDPRINGACPHRCNVRVHPTNDTTMTIPERTSEQCVVFWECRAEFARPDTEAYEKVGFAVLKLDECRFEPLGSYRQRLQVNENPIQERWSDETVRKAFEIMKKFRGENRAIQRVFEEEDRAEGLTKK